MRKHRNITQRFWKGQNSKKRDKLNGSDAEFKTIAMRMLKELIEDINSIKMIQSETKDTLIEIKNNL